MRDRNNNTERSGNLSAFPHLLGGVVGGEHGGHDVHHEVVRVLVLPDPLHEARLGQRHQLALLHAAAAVTRRRKLDTTLSSYRVSQNIGPTFIYSTALEICYMIASRILKIDA